VRPRAGARYLPCPTDPPRRNVFHAVSDQRKFERPLSADQVRRSGARLEMNPYTAPATDTTDGLLRLPALAKERRVVEDDEKPSAGGWDGNLLGRYPVIAHSVRYADAIGEEDLTDRPLALPQFATCPPVTVRLVGARLPGVSQQY
jgi:hypothetical protein